MAAQTSSTHDPEQDAIREVKPLTAGEILWRCGDLRMATVSVGLTSMISVILLTVFYIESLLHSFSFSIEVVIVTLFALFLVVSDCSLIYGATKRYKWLLIPWLFMHLVLFVIFIFILALNFRQLGGKRGVLLLSIVTMAYFYCIVGLFYVELKDLDADREKDPTRESAKPCRDDAMASKPDQHCLIDLEATRATVRSSEDHNQLNTTRNMTYNCADREAMEESVNLSTTTNPFKADDTFLQLVHRTPAATAANPGSLCLNAADVLDDSGEFTVPTSASSTDVDKSFKFFAEKVLRQRDEIERQEQPLPTPDEVIAINGDSDVAPTLSSSRHRSFGCNNPFLESSGGDVIDFGSKATAKSMSHLRRVTESELIEGSAPFSTTGTTRSEEKLVHNVVNMNLVEPFTPFKRKKSGANLLDGACEEPKMKIFLPKNDDDCDDVDSLSSSDSFIGTHKNTNTSEDGQSPLDSCGVDG